MSNDRSSQTGAAVDGLLGCLQVVVYELRTKPARMVTISSAASQVLGYDREDWEQTHFWDRIVHPDDRDRCLAQRAAAIEALADHVLEYRVIEREGTVRWLRDRTQVRNDPDGAGVILRGVILDVTRERAVEEEARRTLEQQVEARRREGLVHLAAGMAVDFEDLLVSIQSCASLLELELERDHPSRRMVRDVLRRCDGALDRVRRLQAFAGVGTHSWSRIDLSDLTRECLRLQVQGRGSRPIHTRLTDGLPPVPVDPGQLGALLDGLVENGLDAVGEGDGEVRVSTDLVELTPEEVLAWKDTPPPPPGRYVRLAVDDDGCGMDDEVRRQAFEPFFSTKGAGRGLGMASALGIAQAAGGSVRVKSEPGKGSRVEVLFPAR